MKPRFALSLSQAKVDLHHRGPDGWVAVGSVSIESDTFLKDLAALRDKGIEMEPRGMDTVLVLPDDQILFTTCTAAPEDRAAILQTLDGLTPYPVDQLEFDAWIQDGQTHLAVVARETLDEAEAFAVDNVFNPVAFSAVARNNHPIWLGPTKSSIVILSRDETEKRDTLAAPGSKISTPTKAETRKDAPAKPAETTDKPPESDEPKISVAPLDPPETRPTFLTSRDGRPKPPKGKPVDVAPRISLGASKPKLEPRLSGGTVAVTAAVAPVIEPASETVIEMKVGPAAQTKPKVEPTEPPKKDLFAEKPAEVEKPASVSVSAPIATTTLVAPPPPANEAEALTVFGARASQTPKKSGRPYLAYGLSAVLLLALGGGALWMALTFSNNIATLPIEDPAEIAAASPRIAAPESTVVVPPVASEPSPVVEEAAPVLNAAQTAPATVPSIPAPVETATPETVEVAAVAPLPVTQTAAPAAPSVPPLADAPVELASLPATQGTDPADAIDPRETAFEGYELTGVWAVAPTVPPSPAPDRLDSLYLAALDPAVRGEDAVALPLLQPDALPGFGSLVSLAPGQTIQLDERGLVIPTPEGTMSPDGILVFAGKPPLVPPSRPASVASVSPEAAAEVLRARLATFTPRPRPGRFADQAERATLGGYSREDLANFRPKPRPRSAQDDAQASEPDAEGTMVASLLPKERPAEKAAAIQKELSKPVAPAVPATSVAVAPRIPTSASVARQATVEDVVNLRRITLIGVFGSGSDRRALVRLPSGKIVKLKVGDRLDGGQVAAIGDGDLRYVKNGRSMVLDVPS
ncbi:hypothetical protein ACMU_11205 [Actibacterium mucosum KCTC 23349]|uniref:Type II secretion system protein GspC N-terminal domain-containing protein n=1 Tax=Actibacterium mucosum KCTC 23349 TaxID=1454373 RepID=A0A037ZFK0_9RHOB|nr:hypothetical protein [Actibacterium mucosum]KAJ55260.1 hypothetical protein ACMU_11205 [Actibacterium mucosum KCTC 23349]